MLRISASALHTCVGAAKARAGRPQRWLRHQRFMPRGSREAQWANEMRTSDDKRDPWPALNYADWRDTLATLQLWTQIVGKVRLVLSPWLNHGWQVPLYVNARGLGTSPIHAGHGILKIDFDLVDHRLIVRTSDAPDRG